MTKTPSLRVSADLHVSQSCALPPHTEGDRERGFFLIEIAEGDRPRCSRANCPLSGCPPRREEEDKEEEERRRRRRRRKRSGTRARARAAKGGVELIYSVLIKVELNYIYRSLDFVRCDSSD